jgi:predicted P-loop ATPase
MKPGCKNDTALILQGSQGYRKTTFFQTLFGDDYFMTLGENANERDDLIDHVQKLGGRVGRVRGSSRA